MQSHSLALCCARLIALLLLPILHAQDPDPDQIDWPNPVWDLVTFGAFAGMTHITHAGDGSGRLFVVEKNGIIRVLQNGEFSTNRFLDIVTKVLTGTERGLFSVAFAPDFKTSGEFYVNYTSRAGGSTVVSRFKVGADTNVVDAATEQVLLVVRQPASNHNGGQIAFGPDGYLYIGMGDGGGQGDPYFTAQDPRSLLGKMLRIDVSGSKINYTIPPTNPFVGRDDVLPEIWAFGLRNPWRFSFDRLTGDLLIADVGESRMEEINFQPGDSFGGENYGWSFYEGTLPFNSPPVGEIPVDLVFPIATYPRSTGRSITGGEVMRGATTNRMYGVYLFSDYITGNFGALKRIGTNWYLADLGVLPNPVQQPLHITSFGQDEDGTIYALELYQNQGGGIFRLRDLNQVHAPRFSIKNGTYTSSQAVHLSTLSPGSRIHYTLDGTDPTESSPSLSPGETLTVSVSSTIKARAYRSDLLPSPVSTLRVTMLLALNIQPSSGPVTNGTTLTIDASASNAVIRYTLDGTPPTDDSPLYTNPISLQGNETLSVIASREGWTSTATNIFFGLLLPEWVTVQTVAGTGQQGTIDGPARLASFLLPFSLCFNPAGSLFIGEIDTLTAGRTQSIRRLSTNQIVDTVWTNIAYPFDLAADSAGNIFILEYGWSRVLRATNESAPSIYLSYQAADWSRGLDVDGSGRIYVGTGSRVSEFSSDGAVRNFQLGVGRVLSTAVTSEGELFVGVSDGVMTFDEELAPERFAGGVLGHADGPRLSAGFNTSSSLYRLDFQMRSLALGTNGDLIVGDGHVLRRIDRDGLVTTLLDRMPTEPGGNSGVIGGIAVHPNGDIYLVADHTIKRISPDSDRDGIADIDEIAPFMVGTDDRLLDSDSDGTSNTLEYLAGTDPLDSASLPELRATAVETGIQLIWSGLAPRGDLILEQSADLTTWVPSTHLFLSGNTVIPGQSTPTFFRARID